MSRSSARALVRALVWLSLVAALAAGAGLLVVRYLRPEVTVTEAVEGPVVQAFYATGTLQPDREYEIRSNVEGILTEVLVDKGQGVEAGRKLAFVRAEDYELRFPQAKADYELKMAMAGADSPILREFDRRLADLNDRLKLARDDEKRIRERFERSVATEAEMNQARSVVLQLWGLSEGLQAQRAARKAELDRDLAVAKSALDIAQWNLDQQSIKSPINGVVLDRPVSANTRVRVNDRLMRIADVRPQALVMRAAVDEEDKTLVRLDPPQVVRMTLYAFPDRVFTGRVVKVYPQADPSLRTFEVDVAVEDWDAAFSAGMTGELAFIIAQRDRATVIPSQAVQNNAVWTVRDGRLARAEATLGLRSIERVEVLAGLRPGDRVVISPLASPRAGQSVRAAWLDPAIAAGLNKPKQDASRFRGFK